jgi:acyl transferase domain-containing protein
MYYIETLWNTSADNLVLAAPGLNISLTLLGSLSPEGSSKSFDASADGYARGEAVTALYVKRLDEAIKDGNPIRAVIRSSATNAYVSNSSHLQYADKVLL